MEELVRKNIVNMLNKVISSIKTGDYSKIRALSNNTVHSASIIQDDYSVSIAVLIYALSKILERESYRIEKGWKKFYNSCLKDLNKAKASLVNKEYGAYEKSLGDLFFSIDKTYPKLKGFIKDVFDKARIHKASRIHEHGISLERTSALLGVSQWELNEYIGKTGMSDVSFTLTSDVKKRIETVRKLFK